MSRILDRLGRGAARYPLLVIAIWVVLAAALVGGARIEGTNYNDNYEVPSSQSQEAINLLQASFPAYAGSTDNQVVVHATSGTLTDPKYQAAIQSSLAALAKVPDVVTVNPPIVSPDTTIGFVSVSFGKPSYQLPASDFTAMQQAMAPAVSAGLEVAYAGDLVSQVEGPTVGNADKIGLAAALVVLLIALGSIVAAGLPIITALVGLAVGLSAVQMLSNVFDLPSLTPTLATMIGLGVGIDYALFVISRHREQIAAGMSIEDSVGLTNATSGKAVVFAGTTVIIAICGLLLVQLPFLTELGLATAGVVAIAVLAAVSLMPALLGLLGHRINALRMPWARHSSGAAAGGVGFWARWATRVGRHPWPIGLVALVVVITLAIPALSMRLGLPDAGSLPTSNTQRQAYDLLSEGFGPGFNGPLLIVVQLPPNGNRTVLSNLASALPTVPDVAAVTPPQISPSGTVAVINVVPKSAPDDPATTTLADRLRVSVIPAASANTGAQVYVSGTTAVFIDLTTRITDRLPLFLGVVILVSFLLLMGVFRSLVIPLTAAVMNVLTVGVGYGVLVAVFQWGWGASLIGLDSTVPISSFVPMMMFAALFGLSTDYEVFLISRMREAWARTGDSRLSVVEGHAAAAKVIVSAAAIMASVFLSFLLVDDPTVQMFGIGLGVAILVDALFIRMMLVPAIMAVLGDANWWVPKWLGKVLPRVDFEGTPDGQEPAPAPAPAVSVSG